jgi:hypothetical protein
MATVSNFVGILTGQDKNQPGSIQVLNPAGKPVVTLESDPDGYFSINNPLGAATIRLSGKGASGWFGGPGAMAARDHSRAFGAVFGKALAPLQSGVGLLPVLVALQ